jgi:hypothetical protein
MAQPSATWWCFSRWIVGMGQGTVAWEVNVIICVLTSLRWQKFYPQRSLFIIAGGIQRKTGSSTCGWSPTVKFQVAIGRLYIYGVWCARFLVPNDVHPPESYGYGSQASNPCSSQMAMVDGNHRRPQMEPVFSGPIADLRRCFLSAGRRCEDSMPFIQKLWPFIVISRDKAIIQLE